MVKTTRTTKVSELAGDFTSQADVFGSLMTKVNESLSLINRKVEEQSSMWKGIKEDADDLLHTMIRNDEVLGKNKEKLEKLVKQVERLQKIEQKIQDIAKKKGFGDEMSKIIASGPKTEKFFKTLIKNITTSTKAWIMFYKNVPLTLLLFKRMQSAVGMLGSIFKTLGGVLSFVGDLFITILGTFTAFVSLVAKSVRGVFSSFIGMLNVGLSVSLKGVGEVGVFAFEAIEDTIKMVIEDMFGLILMVTGAPDAILTPLKQIGGFLYKTFDGIKSVIGETFTNFFDSAIEIGKTILNNILSPFELLNGVLKGISDIVSKTLNGIIKFATETLKNALEVIMNTGKQIISSFFDIMQWFYKLTTEGGGNISQLQQEVQNLVKEFGNLKRAQAETGVALRKGMGSAFSKLGYNVIERQQLVNQFMSDLGGSGAVIIEQFKGLNKTGVDLLLSYYKGLNLTKEALDTVGTLSIATGKSVMSIMKGIHDDVQAIAKRYNLSAKLLSKDVGSMLTDIQTFGGLTVREMTVAAARVKSLGVEIEKIKGIMKAFDTFEDAAKNVSMLNQAFGIQIDTLKMIRQEDPTKRIDMLRQSFYAAGKSAEYMTRRELMLLSSSTGLDEVTARAVFSMKNRGKTQAEIMKQVQAASANKKSDVDRVKELRLEIEKLLKAGPEFAGIWDAISQGAARGVKWWGWMSGTIRNYYKGLRSLHFAARDFIRDFLTKNNYIQAYRELIQEFFGTFVEKREEFKNLFLEFFNGDMSVSTLINKFASKFSPRVLQLFDKVLEGLKKGFGIFAGWIVDGILTVVKHITSGIVKLIKGDFDLTGMAKGWITPIIKALQENIPEIWKNLKFIGGSILDWFVNKGKEFYKIIVENWWPTYIKPALIKLANYLKDWLKNNIFDPYLLPIIVKGLEIVNDFKDKFLGYWEKAKDVFGKVYDVLKKIWSIIKPIVELIAENPITAGVIGMFGPTLLKKVGGSVLGKLISGGGGGLKTATNAAVGAPKPGFLRRFIPDASMTQSGNIKSFLSSGTFDPEFMMLPKNRFTGTVSNMASAAKSSVGGYLKGMPTRFVEGAKSALPTLSLSGAGKSVEAGLQALKSASGVLGKAGILIKGVAGKLPLIGTALTILSGVSDVATSLGKSDTTGALKAAVNTATGIGGVALGAAIGSAILPGVGTVIGGIIGGFLGGPGVGKILDLIFDKDNSVEEANKKLAKSVLKQQAMQEHEFKRQIDSLKKEKERIDSVATLIGEQNSIAKEIAINAAEKSLEPMIEMSKNILDITNGPYSFPEALKKLGLSTKDLVDKGFKPNIEGLKNYGEFINNKVLSRMKEIQDKKQRLEDLDLEIENARIQFNYRKLDREMKRLTGKGSLDQLSGALAGLLSEQERAKQQGNMDRVGILGKDIIKIQEQINLAKKQEMEEELALSKTILKIRKEQSDVIDDIFRVEKSQKFDDFVEYSKRMYNSSLKSVEGSSNTVSNYAVQLFNTVGGIFGNISNMLKGAALSKSVLSNIASTWTKYVNRTAKTATTSQQSSIDQANASLSQVGMSVSDLTNDDGAFKRFAKIPELLPKIKETVVKIIDAIKNGDFATLAKDSNLLTLKTVMFSIGDALGSMAISLPSTNGEKLPELGINLGNFIQNFLSSSEGKIAGTALKDVIENLNNIKVPSITGGNLGDLGKNIGKFLYNFSDQIKSSDMQNATKKLLGNGIEFLDNKFVDRMSKLPNVGNYIFQFVDRLSKISASALSRSKEAVEAAKYVADFTIVDLGNGKTSVQVNSVDPNRNIPIDLTVVFSIGDKEFEAKLRKMGLQMTPVSPVGK